MWATYTRLDPGVNKWNVVHGTGRGVVWMSGDGKGQGTACDSYDRISPLRSSKSLAEPRPD